MTVASEIAAVGAATGGVLIAVEGVAVGLTQLIFENARKQARQEGLKEGLKEGREEGLKEGIQEGIRQGVQQGVQQGIRDGIRQERNRLRKAGVAIPPDDPSN